MDSDPGWDGSLSSIERCFELGGWDVAAVAVEPVVVEPVHPAERFEFELVDVVPAGGVGSVDALGLVESVDCFGEGVVVRICDGADRGSRSDLVESFGETNRRELRAGVGIKPKSA